MLPSAKLLHSSSSSPLPSPLSASWRYKMDIKQCFLIPGGRLFRIFTFMYRSHQDTFLISKYQVQAPTLGNIYHSLHCAIFVILFIVLCTRRWSSPQDIMSTVAPILNITCFNCSSTWPASRTSTSTTSATRSSSSAQPSASSASQVGLRLVYCWVKNEFAERQS